MNDNIIDCDHRFEGGRFGKHDLARCKKCGKSFVDGIFSPTLTEWLS